MSGEIRLERDDSVGILTIAGSSALNLMSAEMCLELHARLMEIEDDPRLRVAIIRGAGDQHFSAGEDRAASAPLLTQEAVLSHYWNATGQGPASFLAAWETLFAWRAVKPIVAAVRGNCFGVSLVAMCTHTDIRIAGESAQFGLPDVRAGIAAGYGGSQLARQLPQVAFTWMLETGLPINAQQAYDWHLVNEVVADERLLERAREVAALIVANPPHALRAEKLGLIHLEQMSYESAALVASAFRALAASHAVTGSS
jgi:enoyl-CoA hydratase/carnithine racemase